MSTTNTTTQNAQDSLPDPLASVETPLTEVLPPSDDAKRLEAVRAQIADLQEKGFALEQSITKNPLVTNQTIDVDPATKTQLLKKFDQTDALLSRLDALQKQAEPTETNES
ncbi:MAG: hypothetical protein WCV84_05370 [Patescibacteria group bacterium]